MTNHKFKILIIQLRQLGDVILTTPLTRQVRKIYPNAEIHFLTENLGSQVYIHNKNVDKLIILPKKMSVLRLIKTYFKIFREKYDLTIDCFCNPKSAQFTFFSGAKERIGFDFPGRKFAYNKIIEQTTNHEYSAVTKLRLISHLGADLTDNKIELPIPDEQKKFAISFFKKHYKTRNLDIASRLPEDKKVIAFNVVSRRDYKIWNAKHYVALGNWLIENNYSLLFTYGPGEYALAKQVYDGLQNKDSALIDYPMLTILELRALLEYCALYIGNDGGIKHLAVCADIPTLTLFQNINWTNWTPPNSEKHFAITNCLKEKNFCKSCFNEDQCFANLSTKEVIEELLKRGLIS